MTVNFAALELENTSPTQCMTQGNLLRLAPLTKPTALRKSLRYFSAALHCKYLSALFESRFSGDLLNLPGPRALASRILRSMVVATRLDGSEPRREQISTKKGAAEDLSTGACRSRRHARFRRIRVLRRCSFANFRAKMYGVVDMATISNGVHASSTRQSTKSVWHSLSSTMCAPDDE